MRVAPRSESKSPGINLTPMIDVSFLLIIFFIVSSHLAQQEVEQELSLPQAASGQPPPDVAGSRLIINVDSQGQLTIGGEELLPRAIEARLTAERAHAGNDLEVRIRSDRSVPYRYVEPILVACSRAGVWKVTFAVHRRDQPLATPTS
jgi:biopolymer transport protein ExbD